ncbi:MAG: LPS export ABC transporter permease LptF [Methylophilaceae bacterium]|jgi:lipopolysaccharide export system permease protein|nr:LPS export ABC transporter permease LptF [Methylophilaceae bacterium]NCV27753.1 LPS export ABC transporter permease LptF [Nitrosomonadales bacterium]NCV37937.1 LPS export ABC transporter permease LptF [Betaproteobacteria bacterium]NCV53445.1 LPS export ABC transporter permease LptF [Betaproteobacteria bacterium]NCW63536.1 LPS export ABC transporter permease LptF [Betaproteobacteria bacterium]
MLYQNKLKNELFFNSLSTILILSGIVVAQRGVIVFRLASKGIIPNDSILTILVFSLLKYLPILLTLTLFLTILLTLSRWFKDSEMMIWFSSGLGLTSFIRPILFFSLPIILLIGFLSLYLSPWATQKSEEYKAGLKNRDELATISPGSFKESKSKDRVFYVEGFGDLGSKVKNVFVQSEQNGKLGIIVSNEGSRVSTNTDDEYIVLKKGKRYEVNHENNHFTEIKFSDYGFLVEKKLPPIIDVNQVEAMPTLLLLLTKGNREIAEFVWRVSLPISGIVLIILAIPLSFINPRSGRSVNIIIAIMIFAIYNNLMGVTQSYINLGKLNPYIGGSIVHLFILLIASYLMLRRNLNLPLLPSQVRNLRRKK